MQAKGFITLQEALEPLLNGTRKRETSRPSPQAFKSTLAFPQQRVEKHEHVWDTTHPPKHYGSYMLLAHCTDRHEVTFPMSYRNVAQTLRIVYVTCTLYRPTRSNISYELQERRFFLSPLPRTASESATTQTPMRSTQWEVVTLALRQVWPLILSHTTLTRSIDVKIHPYCSMTLIIVYYYYYGTCIDCNLINYVQQPI